MTKEEREQKVRECIRDTEEVWDRVCHIDDVTHRALVVSVAKLLASTERAVWEKAASTHFNYCAVSNEEENPDYQICTCDMAELREWCRQQANEIQP